MINKSVSSSGRMISKLLLLGIVAVPLTAPAVTHTVQFGGSLGNVYSPKSLTANIGDTIKWTGDFSMHPLSSTTIPASATAWHMGSGTTPFEYVIKISGTYNYKCDTHVSLGMIGSFTVNTVGTIGNPGIFPVENLAFQIIVSRGYTVARIRNSEPGTFSLKLYDALGSVLNVTPAVQREYGEYRYSFSRLPKGLYIARVAAKGKNFTRSFSIPE
jgi:plastocyanin